MTTAATVHEEVDGEVEEVHKLKQLLPRELAASSFDAAADQVVDDGLDAEHVSRKVQQDCKTAQYQQHPCCTELQVAAGESCSWMMLLDDTHAALML